MSLASSLLALVRSKKPLIHFITNYVTVNDCANITLACGGSPIMADEDTEVEQIVALCSALVLNIGTANQRTLNSMLRAGKHANLLGIPVVFDPVGAGASDFRNGAVRLLQKEVHFSVIKGNISEIQYLYNGISSTKGVDASSHDMVTEANIDTTVRLARHMAEMTGAVVVITGAIDLVADGSEGYVLHNGSPMMSTTTGTGCMSGAVAGCFLGATPNSPLEAVLASTLAMGICGELAEEKARLAGGGNCFFRNALIDAMSSLTGEILSQQSKMERVLNS